MLSLIELRTVQRRSIEIFIYTKKFIRKFYLLANDIGFLFLVACRWSLYGTLL